MKELVTSQRTTPFLEMTLLFLTASFIFFAVHWITFCSPNIYFQWITWFEFLISNLSGRPNIFLGSRTIKNMLLTLPIARSLGLNDIFVLIVCFQFTEGTYSFKVKVNVHSSCFHEVVVFTNLFICCFYIQSTSQ